MMKKNSGNALWFILLAIFLLGGLTVLLSRTGSQTEETGSTERASIYASEILKYAASLETAVAQLLARGCSETQINFDHVDHTPAGAYTNPNAPPDGSCNIFDVRGGGITFQAKKSGWRQNTSSYAFWHLYGAQCVYGVRNGTSTCTAAQTDLLVVAGSIKKDICLEINRRMGISNPAGDAPLEYMSGTKFTGTFSVSGTFANDMIGDSGTATGLPFQYKKTGCMKTAADTYHFYHVVLAR